MASPHQPADETDAASVTIGMPLYNSERTVARAIESLQRQTRGDFRLLVSDNASRDATAHLVEAMARTDERISLIRQPRNLNYGNFRFVLQQARSPYFMFAAGDDWWEDDFIEGCVAALEQSPDAVCAISRVLMHPDHGAPFLSDGTYALTDSVQHNVAQYLWDPGDNSRIYGVFRTEAAQRSFPATDHFAFDWTFCIASLTFGTHVEVPRILMHRELTPARSYVEYVRRDARGRIERAIPLLGMTCHVLGRTRMPRTRQVMRALLALNLTFHVQYVRRYHPWLARSYRAIASVGRRIRSGMPARSRRAD
jgi:glycosyltransferase involved in cell wall biosynthesis